MLGDVERAVGCVEKISRFRDSTSRFSLVGWRRGLSFLSEIVTCWSVDLALSRGSVARASRMPVHLVAKQQLPKFTL